MINRKLYIFLLLFVFVSCETTVQFKGEVEEPLPVLHSEMVAGQPLTAYVGRSYFFLDENVTDLTPVDTNRLEETSNHQLGALTNAIVEYQINSGEWGRMSIYKDTTDNVMMYKAEGYILQPGDAVSLRATCPSIGEVSAEQQLPKPIDFTSSNIIYNDKAYSVDINLLQYQWKENEYVALRLKVELECYDAQDSLLATLSPSTFYCNDSVFERCANLRSSKMNYYPIDGKYLLLPAAVLATADYLLHLNANITFRSRLGQNLKEEDIAKCNLKTTIKVENWTEDTYRYYCTKAIYKGEYPNDNYRDNLGNVFDFDLTEVASEFSTTVSRDFGMESGVQLFCNINGGLGHVTGKAITTEEITYPNINY